MSDQPPTSIPPQFQHSPPLIPPEGVAPPVAAAAVPPAPFLPVVAAPSPVAAVPAESLEYIVARSGARPGVLGAIGVISIIVAALSGLFSLVLMLQGFGLYMMSMAMSSSAAWARGGQTVGAQVASAALGMAPSERQAAVRSLSRAHALDDPRRRAQLDAILATAGRTFGTGAVVDSGTMPDSRGGEPGADFFVTATGRLEVFNDRAVFFPSDGSATVRVSAPQGGGPPVVSSDAEEDEFDSFSTPATAPTTTAASPGGVGALPALSAREAQAVVQQAQSLAQPAPGAQLNPQQVAVLQSLVSVPGQQLVAPGTSRAAVVSSMVQPDGTAVISFANGSVLVLGPQGNIVSQITPAMFATSFSLDPWAIALFIVAAVVSLGLAVLLLVAGILTLRRSASGRRLHLVYACLKIPAAIAGGFAIAYVIYEFGNGFGQGASSAGPKFAGAVGVALVPTLLACIYPVALLVALNVKSVREYYHSVTAGE